MPAFVDKVVEVAAIPKVTLVGYSQGTMAAVAGLAKAGEEFESKLNKTILLTPCMYPHPELDRENFAKVFGQLRSAGVYSLYDSLWGMNREKLCGNAEFADACAFLTTYEGEQTTARIGEHVTQNGLEQRFAEYNPAFPDKENSTPLIPIDSIDYVQVQLVTMSND